MDKMHKMSVISNSPLFQPSVGISFIAQNFILKKFKISLFCVELPKANFFSGMPDQLEASDTSLVWNLCNRSSDVISQENQWWHREMSVVLLS